MRGTFTRWFGSHYDTQYLDIVLAAAAAGIHLDGDPCWLQIIGGAGVGKTETAGSLTGALALIVSSISGEAALLSGSSKKDRDKDSTGGLLRQIGDRGLLVIKDFTTILSMHRESRAVVLSALRETYDGHYVRTLGVDGGKRLTWKGRLAVVSCVTGAYDEHHAVIAAMGERFLLLRVDSEHPDVRRHATRQAICNSGGETAMREELADSVGGFLLNLDRPEPDDIPDDLMDHIIDLADLVAKARSQVARDFKGDPEYAHAPEMPTRLAKQFTQLWRGCRLIGLDPDESRQVLRRVAHDTLPPDRRAVLLAVHDQQGQGTSKTIATAVGISRSKADRVLRELALHKLVEHAEPEHGERLQPWTWHALATVDLEVLRPGYGRTGNRSGNVGPPPSTVPEKSDPPSAGGFEPDSRSDQPSSYQKTTLSDFSGTVAGPCASCGRPIPRYGPDAHPLCDSCAA